MTATPATATPPWPAPQRTAGVTATGRIYFWEDASLWLGAGRGRTQWHEHHAHQIALALDGSFGFRTEATGGWTTYRAAVVPSHCAHQFELDGITVAHLFVEPECRAGRALAARVSERGVVDVDRSDAHAAIEVLRAATAPGNATDRIVAAAKAAIARISGAAPDDDARALDPRLAQAIAYVRAHIREPLTLGRVAAAVALSDSRFRHLFVAATGTSFRAYVLWLRINLAIRAAMAGASWTEAAHDAGFADSAHLSRTHKRMFGIEPTAIRPPAPEPSGH